MREKQKELQQQGNGSKELEQASEEMNKVEIDLVNKRLTNETLKRQQDILTRLLEHEKAERQRDQDNKRKAEVAAEKERKLPPSLEEYIKKREAEIEQYRTVSPALKPYYKNLVEEYYKSLKGTKWSELFLLLNKKGGGNWKPSPFLFSKRLGYGCRWETR